MSRPVCIMMVKAPRAGAVKTRLVPPLSSSEAATLAACFAQDTLAWVRRLVPEVIVAYAPADGRAPLAALFTSDNLLWFEQRGAELGARLTSAAAHAAALGCSPIIIIGTDSPTLPPAYVARAIDSLSAGESDITLGPTEDGGYYLVGLRKFSDGLFRNVAWSTPQVFSQTAGNAARAGLRRLALPRWYDVDTPADLLRLRAELCTDEAARTRAPHTYQWLLAHAASLPASA
ncbi:MAG TPA: TIGR04282 family arsenosugar biosynthesis glycosyltransferase [Pyrinomonadaceae bacterium]